MKLVVFPSFSFFFQGMFTTWWFELDISSRYVCIYESLTQSSSFPNSPSTALTVTLMHPSPENKRKPKAFMITITKKFYIYSHRTSIYLFQRQPSSKTSTLYLPPFLSYSNPGLSSFIPQETLFTHTHTHTLSLSLSWLANVSFLCFSHRCIQKIQEHIESSEMVLDFHI